MEANVLPRPEVLRELKNFVAVELYTDGQSKADRSNQQLLLKLLNTTANPTYAVLTPDGKLVKALEGYRPAQEFTQFLKDARTAAAGQTPPQMAQR
jgi:hypothetical protein